MGNISVVIPTLNEEKYIGQLLEQLQACALVNEMIISDGGSSDGTSQIAKSYSKVKLIQSERGRAVQMNNGAKVAKNEVLLFLHADSHLTKDGLNAIISSLKNGAEAGSFYLKFDINSFWLNLYSRMSRYNLSVFTYGDQGLFIKRELYNKIGGFKPLPIMEDLDIVRRAKRHGVFKKVNEPITTCARRFEKNGVVRQQVANIIMVSLYYCGVSPERLSKYYKY